MSNTLQLGAGKWATGTDTVLAFNDENNNFKPLPFDFSRASSATVVNQSGLIETVGSGEPRIDFKDNTKGALLLEPQRTNSITYSEDFIQWTLVGTPTVTAINNTLTNQDNAYTIDDNNAAGYQRVQVDVTTTAAAQTLSVFIKKKESAVSAYSGVQMGSSNKYIIFDSYNGTYNISSGNDYTEISIKDYGSYWRLKATATTLAESTRIALWGAISTNGTAISPSAIGFETFYGAQLEVGSYATSYIPTSGSAVTRVADSSKIINSPILQATNQFTLFFDAKDFVNYGATFANIMFVLGAAESPYDVGSGIHIYNKIWYYFNGSSAVTLGNCYNATTDSKFAISYDGTKYTKYANGVKLGTNTVSASMSNWDTLTNGSLSYSGVDRVFNLADLKLYNTALTDAELASLTTI